MAYQLRHVSGFLNQDAELKTAVNAVSFSFGVGPLGVNEGRGFIASGVLAANLGLGAAAGGVGTLGFWAQRPTSGSDLFIGLGRQSGVAPPGAVYGVRLTSAGVVEFRSNAVVIGSALSFASSVWQYYHCTFNGTTARLQIYNTSFGLVGETSGASADTPTGEEFGMNTAAQAIGSFSANCARFITFATQLDAYPYEIAELTVDSTVSNNFVLVGAATLSDAVNDDDNATTAGTTGTSVRAGVCNVGDIEAGYSSQTVLVGVGTTVRRTSVAVAAATINVRLGLEGILQSQVSAVTSPVYDVASSNVTAFVDIDAAQLTLDYPGGGATQSSEITDLVMYAVLKLAVEASTSVGVSEAVSDLLAALDNVTTAVGVAEAMTEVQLLLEVSTPVSVTESAEVLAMLEESTTVGVAESAQVDSGGAGNKFLIIDD